jgi:hypothetical protein
MNPQELSHLAPLDGAAFAGQSPASPRAFRRWRQDAALAALGRT